MLKSRNIITTALEETLRVSMARGCPQGSVFLPLLLSLVTDELLWDVSDNDCNAIGYADDTAIVMENYFRLCQRFHKQL
jgi:hypothetical protein